MTEIAKTRLQRLRETMTASGTDLVAVGPSSHMEWLLGLNPHGDERPVMALVTLDHVGVLMPRLNADAARTQTDVPFFEWDDADGPQSALNDLLTANGMTGSRLNIVIDETMRTDFSMLLLNSMDAPKHRFTRDTIGKLRAQKDDAEYTALRASAHLNDRAFQVAFAALKTGMTEIELRDLIVALYKANGADPAFCIVAFGENSAFPHHATGTKILQPNMAVLIDSGCRLDGYPSDMTRCAWYGDPDPAYEKVADIVENAVLAAHKCALPGVACSDIDTAAREVISAAGYGANFTHRTGHGLGVDVHEPPYITASNRELLVTRNVFTIEPGIYLQGQFGIRLEDTMIQRDNHAEILSNTPRTIQWIPAKEPYRRYC